jgi:hypothetical protein
MIPKGMRTMFWKKIWTYYLLRKDPVTFWRKRGAKIGKGAEIYSTVTFGSEPYLINIGDNVRIILRPSFGQWLK